MHIDPVYSLSFVVLTIFMTYFFVKRLGKKGCATFGYIGLVIFCINLFTIFSWVFIYSSSKDVYTVTTSGHKYTATVVSFTEEERYDSEDERYYMLYRPTVQFTKKET